MRHSHVLIVSCSQCENVPGSAAPPPDIRGMHQEMTVGTLRRITGSSETAIRGLSLQCRYSTGLVSISLMTISLYRERTFFLFFFFESELMYRCACYEGTEAVTYYLRIMLTMIVCVCGKVWLWSAIGAAVGWLCVLRVVELENTARRSEARGLVELTITFNVRNQQWRNWPWCRQY